MKLVDCAKAFMQESGHAEDVDTILVIGSLNAKAIGMESINLANSMTVESLATKIMGVNNAKDSSLNVRINGKAREYVSARVLDKSDVTDDGFIFVCSGKRHILIFRAE